VDCLAVVLEAGDDVVLAVADGADDGRDGWQPSFRAAAEARGLRVAAPRSVNAPEFVEAVARLSPDYLLSFQAPQILRTPLIEAASVATLNLHFGPLPRYRGVAPIAWAIINGETATGVTLHHIDPGIDSGDIVASASVAIDPDDTGRTLYDKCTEAGVSLFAESWPSVRGGLVPRRPQSSADALYYNRHSIDFRQRRISWRGDARAIADRARALIFPPFQYPAVALGGMEFDVAGVTWDREPNRGRPGEILAVVDDRLMVAAPGGRLLVGPLRRAGVILGADGLAQSGFAVGVMMDAD
jgi:methionyl-tRNA formyltransferase